MTHAPLSGCLTEAARRLRRLARRDAHALRVLALAATCAALEPLACDALAKYRSHAVATPQKPDVGSHRAAPPSHSDRRSEPNR